MRPLSYSIPSETAQSVYHNMITVMRAMDAFERVVPKRFEPRILEREYNEYDPDPISEADESRWLDVKHGALAFVPSARHDPALFLNVLTNVLDRLSAHGGIFQMAALMIFVGKEVDTQFPAIKEPGPVTFLQTLFAGFARKSLEEEDPIVAAERQALTDTRNALRDPLCEIWLGVLLKGKLTDDEVGTAYTRAMLDSMPGAGLQSDILLPATVRYWRRECNLV
mgnify:CR=1 FL=1